MLDLSPWLLAAVLPSGDPASDWALLKPLWTGPRGPSVDGVCAVRVPDEQAALPSFVGSAGYRSLVLRWEDPEPGPRTWAIEWTPGETGLEQFSVHLNGEEVGRSRLLDAAALVRSDFLDVFPITLQERGPQELEIRHESGDGLNFRSFVYSDAPRPLPPAALRSLEQYEALLGEPGVWLETDQLVLSAPERHEAYARRLARALDEACVVLNEIHGGPPPYRIAIEHFPKDQERGFGGVAADYLVSYPISNLVDESEEFRRHGQPRILGYVEEMSHIYNKGDFYCRGSYESLGVCVSRAVTSRVAGCPPLEEKLGRWRRQEQETFEAYLEAGFENPDPGRYEWGIFYYRILIHLFEREARRKPLEFWKDFFQEMKDQGHPLQRAPEHLRLDVYADVVGRVKGRDVASEWRELGIQPDGEKPWGWRTHEQ